MQNFGTFIAGHEHDDCAKLLMSSVQWPESPIPGTNTRDICASTLEVRRKIRTKLPNWYSVPDLVYPNRLCGEQCSSEATALYKTRLVSHILSHKQKRLIADLTGGLGVDALEMSRVCTRLLYNEMNPVLCSAAKHNFALLGAGNIDISSIKVDTENIGNLLGEFSPSLIFLDPARRSDSGQKVFLPEDCSPDILKLKNLLMDISGDVLIKLSPMADISMLVERMGPELRELHILGSGGPHGECKELLLWLQQGWTGETLMVCADADNPENEFRFLRSQENAAVARLATDSTEFQTIASGAILFEPSSSMMKAGAYKLLSQTLGLTRMGRGVQLYLAPEETDCNSLRPYGKIFKINKVLPLCRQTLKAISTEFPNAEVTARNLHMSSEELKKKMGTRQGSDVHIFGVGCDFGNRDSARCLIVTTTIY